jgi:hypothetical protein
MAWRIAAVGRVLVSLIRSIISGELSSWVCASIAGADTAGKPLRYNRMRREAAVMPSLPARFALLLLLCLPGAHAREVYKCTTTQGDVAYQDKPCVNSSQTTLRVADEVATEPAPSAAHAAVPAAEPPKPPATPRRPRKQLPALWLCTNAEDGSHYASLDVYPAPRFVPLGTLGYPGKSLNDAYRAGANVMSAPELSKPPIDRSPGSAWALGYTQVQDDCALASPDQTCEYLNQQYDLTSDKLRRARFKDEQAQLQPKVDDLEDDLGGC